MSWQRPSSYSRYDDADLHPAEFFYELEGIGMAKCAYYSENGWQRVSWLKREIREDPSKLSNKREELKQQGYTIITVFDFDVKGRVDFLLLHKQIQRDDMGTSDPKVKAVRDGRLEVALKIYDLLKDKDPESLTPTERDILTIADGFRLRLGATVEDIEFRDNGMRRW